MNSNFEHLMNTPAPERGGTIEALRRLDWEFVEYGACVILDRAHAEDPLGDHAAECRRNLVSIRALRKEFGL